MKLSRRNLFCAAAMAAFGRGSYAAVDDRPARMTPRDAGRWPEPAGSEKIAMVLYPGFTALDLFPPQYAFANMKGAAVDLIAKTPAAVPSDTGVAIVPTKTFRESPRALDVLFVPGGASGMLAAMQDEELLNFIADQAAHSRYVTSVCTGSLVLGAAGLLNGYRATSHWALRDQVLPLLGAIPVKQRYVEDRNRITGAGVTSGFEFGLRIVANLRGEGYARAIQLLAEYDTDPVFGAGSPHEAGAATTALVTDFSARFVANAQAVAKQRHTKQIIQ